MRDINNLPSGIFLKLSLAIFAIILSLVTVEVSLRSFYKLRYGYNYYLWPPYLSRDIKIIPNVFPGVSGDKRFYINSVGMRGREQSYDDETRIITMGGSTTESGELDESETWPNLLDYKLNENSSRKVWVGNAGRRGSTTRDNILQMRYFVSQIKNINTIILLTGINDLMLTISTDYKPFDPDSINNPNVAQLDHAFSVHPFTKYGIKGTATWSLLKQIKVATFGRKLIEDNEGKSQTYWREKRQNTDELIDELSDISAGLSEYENNLNLLINMASGRSQRVILLTQPTIYKDQMSDEELKILWFGCIDKKGWLCYSPKALREGMEAFNNKTLEVCSKRQITCIDLADSLPKDTTIFLDDVHFNENGSREVARVIYEYLNSTEPVVNHL